MKEALTQNELLELEFASALHRSTAFRPTDVTIRIDDSPGHSIRHSDDEVRSLNFGSIIGSRRGSCAPESLAPGLHEARSASGTHSPNDWEVMMIAEQMTERDIREMKTAEEVHLLEAASR
jgi:hypothetical protein